MPWLEFKNGLLMKLADVLQTLVTWLTPEVHAPGLQEDTHPQVEDDFRAQWMERHQSSHPPEDWLKLVAESSGGDSSSSIGGKVMHDHPSIAARQAAGQAPARAGAGRETESAPPAGTDEQPHSLQEPQSRQAGLMLAGLMPGSPAASVTKVVLPRPSRIKSEPEARSLVEQVPEAGTEHQESQLSTAVPDAATQNPGEFVEGAKRSKPRSSKPKSSKEGPWLFQAMRKIMTRFRPAVQSSAVPPPRCAATEPVSTNHTESPDIFSEVDAPTDPRQPLPEENEVVARHDVNDAPQASFHRQREIATPVVPWPASTVRVTSAESARWPIPVPVTLGGRERNITTAASSSWMQSSDHEIAPGLPLLPSEFRPSPESSGDSSALYPWPELPSIVEEDPDEPRKLLQNHERQMRVMREQRGAW